MRGIEYEKKEREEEEREREEVERGRSSRDWTVGMEIGVEEEKGDVPENRTFLTLSFFSTVTLAYIGLQREV